MTHATTHRDALVDPAGPVGPVGPVDPADPRDLERLRETLAQLEHDGHGSSNLTPHPPFIDTAGTSARIRYRIHCTGAGCGSYEFDSDHPEASDFLCDDCLNQQD